MPVAGIGHHLIDEVGVARLSASAIALQQTPNFCALLAKDAFKTWSAVLWDCTACKTGYGSRVRYLNWSA